MSEPDKKSRTAKKASMIDQLYWHYVKSTLNYEKIVKQSNFLDNPEWLIIMQIGKCCDSSVRSDMLEVANIFTKLDSKDLNEPFNYRDSECMTFIKIQYLIAIRLFVFEFYYESIDACRKIIELLIRRDLNLKLSDELPRDWRKKVRWDAEDEKSISDLYHELCKSVHAQFSNVWKNSKEHSTYSKKELDEYEKILRPVFGGAHRDHMSELFLNMEGISGLPRYSFKKINETTDLVNKIVKKYQLSKPPPSQPQDSKPESP